MNSKSRSSSVRDVLKDILQEAFVNQTPGHEYCSEMAAQLKIGIELWRRLDIEPTMEMPHPKSRKRLDIFLEYADKRLGIELKYKTRACQGFNFRQQGAQDHGRYDFVRDIWRIESLVSSGFLSGGFACLVTNDRTYWGKLRDESFAKAFQLTEGTKLRGTYTPKWKHRTEPIKLNWEYSVEWFPPDCDLRDNAVFRAVLIEVAEPSLPQYQQPDQA